MKYKIIQTGMSLFQYSKLSLNFLSLMLFLLFLSPLFGLVAEAQQIACPLRGIVQITNEPSGSTEFPSISGDGMYVAFESRANINGGNPNGNDEIYLANIKTGKIDQITDSTNNNSSEKPSLNGDGSRMSFQSRANINGGNPNNLLNAYFFDAASGQITQITNVGMNDQAQDTTISGDGTLITFESDGNFNGGNPDGSKEVWLFNTTNSSFTQITDLPMNSTAQNPVISADGAYIAYQASMGINLNIFLARVSDGSITQISNTTSPGFGVDPAINADGTRITFRRNIGPGNQIVIFDTTTDTLIEVTPPSNVNDPTINGDGTKVSFRANTNIGGMNPGLFTQIWLFDSETSLTTNVTQVTQGGGFSERPSISLDGTRIALESNSNINGGNPDQTPDQIYVALCLNPADGRPIPTLSEWGLIAMAVTLGIVGLLVVRRRMVAA